MSEQIGVERRAEGSTSATTSRKAEPAGSNPTRPSGVAYAPHRRIESGGIRRIVRRARERSVVSGYRAASVGLSFIPTAISEPVAAALFRGGYHAWGAKRRIILANASHVLGRRTDDPEVGRLARRIYATYASFAVELMRLPGLPADEPLRLVAVDGDHGAESFMALWERCCAEGRGLLAVSGHIGSIEVFAGAFALRGVPTYGIADDTAYPELLARLNAQRARWGVTIINWRNLREVFRALRKPAVIGLVVDWGYRPDGVPVQLFGAWTTLPAGPATLAARTGAVILPVVNRRQPDRTYVASHGDPIEVEDNSPATLQRASQQIANALEAMIREAPDQWYCFKPMWPASAAESAALAERARTMSMEGSAS
jgi:KDO2-lipid IV(A) lauroyltransferase